MLHPEHGQHAVPEALHDLPAVRGDGLGQQSIVDSAEGLGSLFTEQDAKLRGTDEVGHQDRRRLRAHARPFRSPRR
jgi:hypothetical protein